MLTLWIYQLVDSDEPLNPYGAERGGIAVQPLDEYLAEGEELTGDEPCFNTEPPYRCLFCGLPSWIDPSDQSPPPDYCHESDHGSPD